MTHDQEQARIIFMLLLIGIPTILFIYFLPSVIYCRAWGRFKPLFVFANLIIAPTAFGWLFLLSLAIIAEQNSHNLRKR
jgi:hypothetical protein